MKKKGNKGLPAISTASLPDVIFMILFFFMVSTTMRDQEVLVRFKLPEASEVQKLEKKNLVSYINIGQPTPSMQAKYGTATQIQLNDSYKTAKDIGDFIAAERDQLNGMYQIGPVHQDGYDYRRQAGTSSSQCSEDILRRNEIAGLLTPITLHIRNRPPLVVADDFFILGNRSSIGTQPMDVMPLRDRYAPRPLAARIPYIIYDMPCAAILSRK